MEQVEGTHCDARTINGRDFVDPSILVVNCTSRSKEPWCHGLSPFFLGPVELYDGHVALNMENAWQYAKVYKQHVDPITGEPTADYWAWAKAGWANPDPVRFPMGRGAVPEYSYWAGAKLGYVAARKRIYAPLYARLVENTIAFKKLEKLYHKHAQLRLWDFDGYDHVVLGRTLEQVLNDPKRKMGHAFVLLMLLRGERLWEHCDIPELEYDPTKLQKPDNDNNKDNQQKPTGPLISAGFLIRSAGLYLVCHATTGRPPSRTNNQWTVSKGMLDPGETPIEAALRELREETGIDLRGEDDMPQLAGLVPSADVQPISSYSVGRGAGKKQVQVYAIDDEEGLLRLHRTRVLECSSIIEGEYTPVARRGLPEIDDFAWVTHEEAHDLVFPSQKHLFGSPDAQSTGPPQVKAKAKAKAKRRR